MRRYANLSGDSGIAGFDIKADSITVYFIGGAAYVYTHASTGAAAVDRMKSLAVAGRGLSTFIAQAVKDRYARKFQWRG